jgi:head-tail adaptor
MALSSFAAVSFAAQTFAAGEFSGASQGRFLASFKAKSFASNSFAAGTFTGINVVADPEQLGPVTIDMQCTPALTRTLDFSQDHLVWDNYLTVSYLSVRKSGDQMYCPQRCHKHAISQKELAASDGVYVPTDVMLRMPGNQPFLPKPRDRWTDEMGTTWTVLEVARIVTLSRYRLVSRDLILHHDLRDAIDVMTPNYTFDASGIRIKTFTSKYTGIAARVQPISADILDERGVRGLRISHQCIVGQELDVTNEDRVNFGGKHYEIRGFHNPERIDELQVLDLELVP